MTRLYIFDLEGTTGIYTTNSGHIHDIALVKPGLASAFQMISDSPDAKMAIATRAPRSLAEAVVRTWQANGLAWNGRVYGKEDIELPHEDLISYKDLSQILSDHQISSPADQAIILGDFLRFESGERYSSDDYRTFNFSQDPSVLTTNYALNDHPFPNGQDTPIYVVVPQCWTTHNTNGAKESLRMDYVIGLLEMIHEVGQGSFARGFTQMRELDEPVVEFVEDRTLALTKLEKDHTQRYIIMKGTQNEWNPLQRLDHAA